MSVSPHDHAMEKLAEASMPDKLRALEAENATLKADNERLAQENGSLRDDTLRLQLELDDMTAKATASDPGKSVPGTEGTANPALPHSPNIGGAPESHGLHVAKTEEPSNGNA